MSLPLLLSSCLGGKLARQLDWHEAELKRAAYGDISNEEKLDVLLTSFTKMAHETLQPLNPKTGVKYVKQYATRNDAHIDKILKDVKTWQSDMRTAELIAQGVRMVQKPYMEDVIELVPKFEKKYRQYKFALQLSDKVMGSLTRFGGDLIKKLD